MLSPEPSMLLLLSCTMSRALVSLRGTGIRIRGLLLSLLLFCCAQPYHELWLVAIVGSLHCCCGLTSFVQCCLIDSHSRAAEGQGA